MNTKERAFNLIAKTQQHLQKEELGSQKVELAAPSLQEYFQKAQRIYLDARTAAEQKVHNGADEMFQARKELSNLSKELDKQFQKVSKTADDLGVDIYTTQVGKNFKAASEEIEKYSIDSQSAQLKIEKFKI